MKLRHLGVGLLAATMLLLGAATGASAADCYVRPDCINTAGCAKTRVAAAPAPKPVVKKVAVKRAAPCRSCGKVHTRAAVRKAPVRKAHVHKASCASCGRR